MFETMNKKIGAVVGAIAISAAGLLAIANFEGKENAPYRDIANVWTVCYGSTGAHVVPGGTRTDEECLTLLDEDVDRFEAAVNRCTPAPKTQNQFDAMVSFSFNIGESAYCNSTFARKFNAGDIEGASDEFLRWNKARVNGKLVPVRGLTRRRTAERDLFLDGAVIGGVQPPGYGVGSVPTDTPECRPAPGNGA